MGPSGKTCTTGCRSSRSTSPPLRERPDDIPLLLRYFCAKHGNPQVGFDRRALDTLVKYGWPGNVRELENTVERLLIMRNTRYHRPGNLPDKIRSRIGAPSGTSAVINLPPEGYSLEQLEREVVVAALERNNWNQTAAARFLPHPPPHPHLPYGEIRHHPSGEVKQIKTVLSLALYRSLEHTEAQRKSKTKRFRGKPNILFFCVFSVPL